MDIEEVAHDAPGEDRQASRSIRPPASRPSTAASSPSRSASTGKQVGSVRRACWAALYKAFTELDCSLVEINPLVVTGAGDVIALDAKMNFDDNALFRHPDIEALRDVDEEDPAETRGRQVRAELRQARRQHRLHGERRRPRHGDHGHHQALRRQRRPTSSMSAAAPPRSG